MNDSNARRGFIVVAGCALAFAALSAHSADEEAVAKARAGVAEIGKQWNGEVNLATQALLLELHRTADRSGVKATMDVKYGPHALQGMDIFTPESRPSEPAPVVVYLHGGALVRGDKLLASSDLISSNIPTFFARNGIVGINANYRLAPEVRWPAGPEDIRSILAWIRDYIEDYGGDPQKVFMMGNSAGGRVVASYLFHEPSHFDNGPGVIGALLSSSSYSNGNSEVHRAYYGEDLAVREALVPLGLVDSYDGPEIPIFMWSAEFDPASIEAPVGAMYAKLCMKYADCPRFTQFQGHNHVSHVMSINTADDEVAREALDFVRSIAP